MKKIILLFILLSFIYTLKCQNINKPYGFLAGDTICIYKNYRDNEPIYIISTILLMIVFSKLRS